LSQGCEISGLGQERLSYDQLNGADKTDRLTGGVEWQQQLPDHYNLRMAAESYASQNRYSIGIERALNGADGGRHSLGASFIGVQGCSGLGNDQQFKLSYRYAFGVGANNRPAAPTMTSLKNAAALGQNGGDSQTAGFGVSLLDQVAQRPGYIPSHVVAKVDTTALPTRLVAVDKTTLPAGTTIDAATGDITTPLGVAVTGIASVTRNGTAFANTSQFALSGNNLITRPSQIAQPAVGVVETYVVTINNSGGGTTLATVLVSRGSVKIDSITISNAAGNTPPMALDFTYNNFGQTTIVPIPVDFSPYVSDLETPVANLALVIKSDLVPFNYDTSQWPIVLVSSVVPYGGDNFITYTVRDSGGLESAIKTLTFLDY
jgi:hypothetical protein